MTRPEAPRPLRQQLLVAFLALSLLPVLVLGGIQYSQSRQEVSAVVQQAQAADLRTAVSARNYAQSSIKLSLSAVIPLASDPAILRADAAQVGKRLLELTNRLPLVNNIALVDRRGGVVASAAGLSAMKGRSVLGIVPGLDATLKTGSTVYGDVYRSPFTGLPLLSHTVAIRRPGGPVVGAVVVDIGFKEYRQQLAGPRQTTAGNDLYIADRMGNTARIVFSTSRPHLAEILADATREPPVARALAGQDVGILDPYVSLLSGRQEVAAFAVVQPADWVVVATTDYGILSSISQTQAVGTLSTLLALALLATLGAIWLSRRFAGPLTQLSQAVRGLPAGEFQIPETAGLASREYAVLVGALQEATKELSARRQALEDSRRNLRELVRERTVALEATNRIIGRLAGTTSLAEGLNAITPLLERLVAFDHLLICRYDALTDGLMPIVRFPDGGTLFTVGAPIPVAATGFGRALHERQARVEDDLHRQGLEGSVLATEGYRSRLVLPIQLYNQRVVGLLVLASRQPASYSDADAERLTPICEQIGLAMERESLIAGLQQRRQDAEVLLRVAGALSRSLRLEELAPQLLVAMNEAFGTDRSDLWLIDRESQQACCFASLGPQAEVLQGKCFPRSELEPSGLADQIDAGEPILIPDIRVSALADNPMVQATGVKSIAIFPLKTAGPALGFVILAYDQPGVVFPEERLPYAQTMASQAATAVANAQLYQRLQDSLTHLQQVQEQLIRSERMSAIGQLASTVAHEIKNRFNVIQAGAFLVEMLAGRSDSAERIKETMAKIKREVERGNGIIMTLLQYARPKEPKREPVRLADVIDTALSIARRANVIIERRVPRDLPRTPGDPAQLEQVFLNLFLNAVQAMPNGGTLTVAALRQDDEVVVRISDTGTGMSPEVREHLFEAFYTTKPGGTGLGLLITKQIVSQHNGFIECESTPGVGTTFTVRLPLAAAGTQSEAA